MLRRIAGGVVAVLTVLAAYGCGGSGTDTTVGTRTTEHRSALVPADGTVTAAGLRTVTYEGIAFDVPADWPVYDLAADASTCVRFDVNAVYLGAPGVDMRCPAGIVGRADALLLEPASRAHANAKSEHAVATVTDAGLDVQVAPDPTASALAATIPSAGIDATLTYQDSDAGVQQILRSFRMAPR